MCYHQYLEWEQNRNPKRAIMEAKWGFDCKQAMHLYRLMIQGKEILLTGDLVVRRHDIEVLKEIKSGGWSYDRVLKFAEDLDAELNEIYNSKRYVVPHHADTKKVNELCMEVIEGFLKEL